MERSERRFELPSDALLVLIGPAGCGKSTFAERAFRPTQVVSSDECRALVSDDEGNAAASRDAFALMHFILDKRLKRGRLCVADATNVDAGKRAELLAIAQHHRRPAFALVFALPVEVCLQRNLERVGRVLPPAAIHSHARQMRESLPHLAEEGFSRVLVLSDPDEVGALEVVTVTADATAARPPSSGPAPAGRRGR